MSKDDDAVFPPDWDWQKYEPAVREEAAQRHIQNEFAEIVSPAHRPDGRKPRRTRSYQR